MDSDKDAIVCPVCFGLYDDPRNLPCGHSFCFNCISQVAGQRQHFPCPTCRADVKLDVQGVKELPMNYSLGQIIEHQEKMFSIQCREHKKPLDMFCAQCDMMICSKCLVRSHSGHHIVETEEEFNKRKGRIADLLESTKPWQAQVKEKTVEVRSSKQSMQEAVEAINAKIDEKFRRWSDDLETQRQILRQHVSDKRKQMMKVFDDYLTVLDSANAEISSIQTEMNTTLSKDTTSVVQLCRSMEKSHEKVEKKTKEVMAASFVLPKDLKIDICAPLLEEAIQNIKPFEPGQIDPYRPTILAEMFCETYDNEWTDAYEELSEHLGDKDKEIISYLRELLLEINSVCKDIYSSKLKTVEEAFVKASALSDKTKAHSEIFKRLKDGLKSMVPTLLEQTRERVLESLKAKFSAKPVAGCLQFRSIQKYIDSCMKVCWYMSAQDPQMIMDISKSPDGKFDNNKYICYTRSGSYVEFVVWPALYLFQGGPIVYKGRAQGAEKISKSQ